MSVRKLPSNDVVRWLVCDEGWSVQRVADKYGTAKSAVSACLRRMDVHSPREQTVSYKDFVPWRVRVEHNNTDLVRKLRLYGRRRMGLSMRPDQLARLDQFLALLEETGQVVAYSPDKGFYYVPRLPQDEGGIIRRPA